MSAYDQIYKAYTESQKNHLWDAWGIVASPRIIYELIAERMDHIIVHNTDAGALEKVFGLVVIPCDLLDDEGCYIVDEQLGRTILQALQSVKGAEEVVNDCHDLVKDLVKDSGQ